MIVVLRLHKRVVEGQKTGNPINCAKQLRRLAKITGEVLMTPSETVPEGGSLGMREREDFVGLMSRGESRFAEEARREQ